MRSDDGDGSRAAWARGFVALWAVLAMGLGLLASPAAAPFAYVANARSNTVSVIDMATNTVVATVTVGSFPQAVAVVPDGKHAYVANYFDNTVSVIDTASNMDGISSISLTTAVNCTVMPALPETFTPPNTSTIPVTFTKTDQRNPRSSRSAHARPVDPAALSTLSSRSSN